MVQTVSGSARVACIGPQDVAIGDGLYLVAPAHSGEFACHVCQGPETVCKRAQGRVPCRIGFLQDHASPQRPFETLSVVYNNLFDVDVVFKTEWRSECDVRNQRFIAQQFDTPILAEDTAHFLQSLRSQSFSPGRQKSCRTSI